MYSGGYLPEYAKIAHYCISCINYGVGKHYIGLSASFQKNCRARRLSGPCLVADRADAVPANRVDWKGQCSVYPRPSIILFQFVISQIMLQIIHSFHSLPFHYLRCYPANVNTCPHIWQHSKSTHGLEKEAAICINVCHCHAIFMSYDWRSGFFRVWNTLPSSITASETLGTFKRRLKTHLFVTSSSKLFPICVRRILFCCFICKMFCK